MKEMFSENKDAFLEVEDKPFELLEGETLIDDAFVVRKSCFGLYSSIGVDGRKWVTGLTEEAVIFGTRFNLKAEIDGTLWKGDNVQVIGSANVGGKL